MTTKRTLRERAPITVVPLLVTQKNCFAVLGIEERPFLEMVLPLCGVGHVIKLGKIRAIPVDVVIAKLRDLAAKATDVEPPRLREDDDQPQTADDVLRALGMRRAS